MNIKKLNLDHFGKFRNKEVSLSPGVNIIYGGNESGKTTIHAFIQCMFFGAKNISDIASREMYEKYQPHDGSTSYAGTMSFNYQGTSWRLIRNFNKDASAFSLIDERTGKQRMFRDGENIDSFIDAMTISSYRNAISADQLVLAPDEQFKQEMREHINDIEHNDDAVDMTKALEYLQEQKKRFKARVTEDEFKSYQDKRNTLAENIAEEVAIESERETVETEIQKIEDKILRLQSTENSSYSNDRAERVRGMKLLRKSDELAEKYNKKMEQIEALEELLEKGDKEEVADGEMESAEDVMKEYRENEKLLRELHADKKVLQKKRVLFLPLWAHSILVLLAFVACAFVMLGGNYISFLHDDRRLLSISIVVAFIGVELLCAVMTLMSYIFGKVLPLRRLNKNIKAWEDEQQAILEDYNIDNISEIYSVNIQRRQEKRFEGKHEIQHEMTQIQEEADEIKAEYDRIQKPLQAYLNKYGDELSEEEADAEIQNKIDALQDRQREYIKKAEALQERLEQINIKKMRISELDEYILKMRAEKKQGNEDIAALNIAESVIKEIEDSSHSSFTNNLSEYVSHVFSKMTAGRHQRLVLNRNFQILVDDGRQLLPPEQFSASVADQVYLAEKIAFNQMLFEEPMPLILDDSFVRYDDNRLRDTLNCLVEQSGIGQIIIFTSQQREKKILDKARRAYHYIEI